MATFASRRAGRRSKSSARYRLPTGGLLTGIWTLRYTICAHPSTLLIQAGHQASRTSHFAFFFLASIPERSHPFPSRTRKLSSPGPMVLQGQPCGRVGRCRVFEGSLARVGLLLFRCAIIRAPHTARDSPRGPSSFSARERRQMARPWQRPADHLGGALVCAWRSPRPPSAPDSTERLRCAVRSPRALLRSTHYSF